jgi:hypothetical protein
VLATRDGREHGGAPRRRWDCHHPHPGLAEDAATVAPWRLQVLLSTSATAAFPTAQLPTPAPDLPAR